MSIAAFELTPGVTVRPGHDLFLLAGPCVIESADVCLEVATTLKAVCAELGLAYVFKASFDKANRTSVESYRGPGLERGLEILQRVKDEVGVPVVTDVHESHQVAPVSQVADVIQIPAFLCRQTDLLLAAGRSGRTVNVKKGQFLAPEAMAAVVQKIRHTGNDRILLTERGAAFGYGRLVVDMTAIPAMRALGCPVVYDATHAVQMPGSLGNATGGRREMIPVLLRAALAAGADGVFMETHPDPDKARCDGPNSLPLHEVQELMKQGQQIHGLVHGSTAN